MLKPLAALALLLAAAGAQAQDAAGAADPAMAADAAPATTVESPATDSAAPDATTDPAAPADDFDFFSDAPIATEELVELPPPKSQWLTIGGPAALLCLFPLMVLVFWWMVPFEPGGVSIDLREYPTGLRRGLAMAICFFGIAFLFGISEVHYQLSLHGSTEAYFQQMSLGKLIAFTHAHLFGFTTSFLIIGIPFSLQFAHLWPYQWIFPLGLAASIVDVGSWWGLKFISTNFEVVTYFCGVVFSLSYLYMLIGLLRVLWFPDVNWRSDRNYRERLEQQRALADEAEYHEGDV